MFVYLIYANVKSRPLRHLATFDSFRLTSAQKNKQVFRRVYEFHIKNAWENTDIFVYILYLQTIFTGWSWLCLDDSCE